VQRPGVSETIAADLRLLRIISVLIDATGLTKRAPLRPIFEEFRDWTIEELDYRIEGSHVREIYEKAVGSRTERIPRVYWSYTTRRVLTLERLHGVWVKDLMQSLQTSRGATVEILSRCNTNLDEVSLNLLRNTLRQIFVYGVFHADPHAANVLVMDNGTIGYVDFGIIGRISGGRRELQVRLHVALESGDFEQFYGAVLATLQPPYGADLISFEQVVRRHYTVWLNAQWMGTAGIREKSFARLMLGISNAVQRSGLAFKTVELRIFRALATVDAVLLQFAPDLDVRQELRHFFAAYRLFRFLSSDIPGLMHKIPDVTQLVFPYFEVPRWLEEARVSRFRRSLGVICVAVGAVVICLVPVLVVTPRLRVEAQNLLQLRRASMYLLVLTAGVLAMWFGHLLQLRSVVRRYVVEERRGYRDREYA
jgi:predicted unusual protein kinase regulating ubiquinone biosynthesis (AarF/ABC1/UbiB family)